MSKDTDVTVIRRLLDRLWSHRDVQGNDGVGVLEYAEQLTHLLCLQIAHEHATGRARPEEIAPGEFSWTHLAAGPRWFCQTSVTSWAGWDWAEVDENVLTAG